MASVHRLKTVSVYGFLVAIIVLSGCVQRAFVSVSGSQVKTLIPAHQVCTNQGGGFVTINVPGPGAVTVNAQAMIGLKSHTTGQIDMAMLHIGSTATDCSYHERLEGYSMMGFSIPKDEPSWNASVVRLIPVTLSRTFQVASAGSRTYYLNGRHVSGSGPVKIWASSLQAAYYPTQ